LPASLATSTSLPKAKPANLVACTPMERERRREDERKAEVVEAIKEEGV
jgi:hypothetical protein